MTNPDGNPVCTMTCHSSPMETNNTGTNGSGWCGITPGAQRLDVSPWTLRRWINEGRIPAYKLGTHWRVKVADLDALLVPSRPGGGAA